MVRQIIQKNSSVKLMMDFEKLIILLFAFLITI